LNIREKRERKGGNAFILCALVIKEKKVSKKICRGERKKGEAFPHLRGEGRGKDNLQSIRKEERKK